jgi:hypothetical protein
MRLVFLPHAKEEMLQVRLSCQEAFEFQMEMEARPSQKQEEDRQHHFQIVLNIDPGE